MKTRLLALIALMRVNKILVACSTCLIALAVWSFVEHRRILAVQKQIHDAPIVQVTVPSGEHKLGSVIIPQQAGDFWVNNTATTPFAIKDTGGVTRDTIETVHGRVTAGNGGSDFQTIIGPIVGAETLGSGMWAIGNGVTASASNYAFQGDGVNTYINAPGSTGFVQFRANNIATGKLAQFAGGSWAYWVGATGAFTSTNPAIVSDASTFTVLNAPSAGILDFDIGAASKVLEMAGGTQNGIALGSTVATAGHMRSPSGLQWLSRNPGNTADNSVIYDDGANSLYFGQNGYTSVTCGGASATTANLMASGTVRIQATPSGANIGNPLTFLDIASMNGAMQLTTISIAANRTLDTTTKDNVVIVDTSSGVVSVTLPTPTNGRWMTIVDKKNTFGTNACTLVRHAAEKIDNVAASKTLNASGYRGNIMSDGTDWYSMNVSGSKPAALSGALLALGLLIARRRRADNDLEVSKEAA